MKQKWRTDSPPKGVLVLGKGEHVLAKVRAVYGGDGVLPHWESEDGNTKYGPNYFQAWRLINDRNKKQGATPGTGRRIKPID